MYHQFKELADVDITAEPMEIGPTCHYVMGGVEVDADTELSGSPACTPWGSAPAACTAPTGSAATRSRDLLVFGRRAGEAAAAYAAGLGERPTGRCDEAVKAAEATRSLGAVRRSTRAASAHENPYTIQQDLQQTMNDLVGIIRTGRRARASRWRRSRSSRRARSTCVVEGHRQYNPGWHLALDLRNMLLVSECIAKAALERQESRGGHTRDDFPGPDDEWGTKNLVLRSTPPAPAST